MEWLQYDTTLEMRINFKNYYEIILSNPLWICTAIVEIYNWRGKAKGRRTIKKLKIGR